MILNAYAILDLFIVFLRVLLGLLVVWLSGRAWRQSRRAHGPEEKGRLEERLYLVFLVGIVLLGLSVVSWPLLYLLLHSYVPEWPGVMCVYGVTRIGEGSLGPSRYLPGLLRLLQIGKPVLVFLGGAWFVTYLVNRRTATAPLQGRLLLMLQLLGLLATVDAVAEASYLLIPKREEMLSVGCCVEAFDAADRATRVVPGAMFGTYYRPWLFAAYYAVNVGLVLALAVAMRGVKPGRWLGLLFAGAWLSLAINWIFLVEIVSPWLLRLPEHYCPYDLLDSAPESVLAAALFVLGSFAIGWAVCVDRIARTTETAPYLDEFIRQLLFLAFLGYLGSVIMTSVELYLA